MRILIVSAVFPPEPVVSARLSLDIARALSERKENEVVVISPKPTRPNGKKYDDTVFFEENFSHHIVESYTHPASTFLGRMKESYSFGKKTAEYVRQHRLEIDVIYANTWPIFGQYLLVNEAQKQGIPIVLHIQDIYPESMLSRLGVLRNSTKTILTLLDRKICKKADVLLTISDNMKSYLHKSRNIPLDKLVVVRNWQDPSSFTISKALGDNKFIFMFVGSISPAAGVLFVLQAFVEANIPNTKLVIAGDGSDKQKCIDYAQLYPNLDIEFCSVMPETVAEVQSRADVLLLPLRTGVSTTASPSKMPAYMFSAKPILACVEEDSDAASIIQKSQSGWICPPENKEKLIAKMREVSKLPNETLNEFGDNGRKYALVTFTKPTNIEKIISNINKFDGDKTD